MTKKFIIRVRLVAVIGRELARKKYSSKAAHKQQLPLIVFF
jgi:hypothetical protein